LEFKAASPGGVEISFQVLVKEVKEKKLPEATDAWVAENSEFETLDELRADMKERIGRVKIVQAQLALRENAVAALIELVEDEVVPEVLVEDEVHQRVHDLNHRLEQQRVTIDQLLAASGRTGDELLAEIRVEAHRAVKQDLALRAVAEAQKIEVSDEMLDDEVAAMAARLDVTPDALRAQLDRAGRTAAVRSETRKRLALNWLLDNIELVDEEGKPVSRERLRVDQGAESSDGTAGEGVEEVDAKVQEAGVVEEVDA
jgi:trigger factor